LSGTLSACRCEDFLVNRFGREKSMYPNLADYALPEQPSDDLVVNFWLIDRGENAHIVAALKAVYAV
jgi:hypothetical protein